MREERRFFNRGPSFGPNERKVVTSRAGLVEFRLAPTSLIGCVDTVPDFPLSVNQGRREKADKKHKRHKQNLCASCVLLCFLYSFSDHFPVFVIKSRRSAAVFSLPRPPPPRAPAPAAPPRPPPPAPDAMSRGVRPCLSFLSSLAPFSATYSITAFEPRPAALCRIVCPFVLKAFTSTPCSTRSFTASSELAIIAVVVRSFKVSVALAPLSSNVRMTGRSFVFAARISGVVPSPSEVSPTRLLCRPIIGFVSLAFGSAPLATRILIISAASISSSSLGFGRVIMPAGERISTAA